ncbi:Diguanylate cyclase [Gammaproteobacteria bacterium]
MIEPISEITDSKEGTILLVDDQPEQIRIIKSALDSFFFIKIATRGELAIKIANIGGVDLILLDVVMPAMDGYETCRQLKNNPLTKNIPVIFLTGKESQNDETVGLELGAVDFIRKPSSPLVLLTRCRNTISYQRIKEDLQRKNDELSEKNKQLLVLNKMLENLSVTDGLTGIPNRRKFEEYLIQEWSRALRDSSPISMIVIDVDYFKLFNDHYGHLAGDDCLKTIAKTLATSTARSFRSGGALWRGGVCLHPTKSGFLGPSFYGESVDRKY